jgi:hypothetical protein
MKKHTNNELRDKAYLAKQRLRLGGYQASNAVATQATSKAITQQDEKLYKRICKMLDTDGDISDPIGSLLDKDIYDGLDSRGKQRYVLELSAKFREMSERYRLDRIQN